MHKMWLLLKVQIMDMIGLNRMVKSHKHGKGKLAAWLGLVLLIVLVLPFSVGTYMYLIAYGLNMLGQIALFPAVALGVAFMTTLVTTVYKVNGTLFRFKDYDMVMALPVKESAVVGSRVLMLYMMNILFTLLIMVPAGAIYAWFVRPDARFYIYYILTLLCAPLVPVVIGSFLGALVSQISSRFRGARIIQIILLLAVTLLPMSLAFFVQGDEVQMQNALTNLGGMLSSMIQRIYPLAPIYTAAVAKYDVGALLQFLAISLGLFAGFSWLVGVFFKSINTRLNAVHTRRNFVLRAQVSRGAFKALFIRECKRYFASTIYLFNTAIGPIMALIAAIALLIGGTDALSNFARIPELGRYAAPMLTLVLCFTATMTNVTGSSISLEGKWMWILKSIPQPPMTILHAKLLLNLVVTVPALIVAGALISIAMPMTALDLLAIFTLPSVCAAFVALLGLLFNLKWHRFDWANETSVVKRGAGASIPLLIAMLPIMGAFALVATHPDIPVIWLALAVYGMADILLYIALQRRGVKLFEAL